MDAARRGLRFALRKLKLAARRPKRGRLTAAKQAAGVVGHDDVSAAECDAGRSLQELGREIDEASTGASWRIEE